MNALLENSKEALPLTELSRSTKRILEEFKSGEKEKYVVMRNNLPEAVLMSVECYEGLINLIDSFRLELLQHSGQLKEFKDIAENKLKET